MKLNGTLLSVSANSLSETRPWRLVISRIFLMVMDIWWLDVQPLDTAECAPCSPVHCMRLVNLSTTPIKPNPESLYPNLFSNIRARFLFFVQDVQTATSKSRHSLLCRSNGKKMDVTETLIGAALCARISSNRPGGPLCVCRQLLRWGPCNLGFMMCDPCEWIPFVRFDEGCRQGYYHAGDHRTGWLHPAKVCIEHVEIHSTSDDLQISDQLLLYSETRTNLSTLIGDCSYSCHLK